MKNIVLITGGAKGIGREIALTFAKNNFDIIVNYNSSELEAISLKNEIEKLGAICHIYKCDLTDFNQIDNMFENIFKLYKKIDVLVNNAGISLSKLLIDCSINEIEKVICTNLTATITVSKIVSENMLKYKSGKIINISSIWGQCGASMETVYSASKAGIIGFTKALAKELCYSNITVNAVAPGAIKTDMLNNLTKQETKNLASEIPLQKLGTTQDVADAVLFLAQADYITGEVLSVNGGLLI